MTYIFVEALVMAWLVIFKANNSVYQRRRIIKAIYDYSQNTGDVEKSIEFVKSMESMEETLFRFWDWGYKRIVPVEVLTEIEIYIKPSQKRNCDDTKI